MAKTIRQWLARVKSLVQDQRGLGLVESLVAVAILGSAVVTFVVALSAGSIAVREQDEQVVAQSLAQTQLEYIKAQDYILTADYEPNDPEASYTTVDTPEGYTVAVGVASIPDTDTDIQKVTVTIYRESENIMTVADYKVNR